MKHLILTSAVVLSFIHLEHSAKAAPTHLGQCPEPGSLYEQTVDITVPPLTFELDAPSFEKGDPGHFTFLKAVFSQPSYRQVICYYKGFDQVLKIVTTIPKGYNFTSCTLGGNTSMKPCTKSAHECSISCGQ
jgi:hypothetical protein